MLKITETMERGNTVRLRLDGTISTDGLKELIRACAIHRNGSNHIVILDMGGVEYMNDQVARELVNMRSESLRIINCSPFIATLLETISIGELGE